MIFIIILMAMVITTIAIGMKLEKVQILLSGLFSLFSLILIANMISDYTYSKTVVTNVYEIKEIVGSFKTKEIVLGDKKVVAYLDQNNEIAIMKNDKIYSNWNNLEHDFGDLYFDYKVTSYKNNASFFAFPVNSQKEEKTLYRK